MRILYGTRVLHDRAAGPLLLGVELTRSLREAATLKFKVPATHECAGVIELESVDPEIEVWEGGRCLMKGRAYACEDVDGVGTVEYSCEGELAYLNDVSARPYSTVAGEAPLLAPSDPYGYFAWLVAAYNAKVEPAKRMEVGVNQGHLLDKNNHILRSDSTYPSIGKIVKDKLLESLGGFVRARYEDGVRYIDYLADTDGTASQRIEFGTNLLKFARTRDGSPVCSAVVALGAKDEETGERLTIASLGNGGADGYGRYAKRHGDTVVSVDLVAKVGYREAVVEWDDVTQPENLLSRAIAWLPAQADEIETLNVRAYDLSRIDASVEPIELGDYVRVTSAPHGYDSHMIVSKVVSRDSDPYGDEYVFGLEGEDIGGIVRKHAARLDAGINQAYEKAESVDKIAKDAQDRADAAASDAQKAQEEADAAKLAAEEAKRAAEEAAAEIERAYQEALDAARKAEEAKKAADDATAVTTVIQRQVDEVVSDAEAAQAGADAAKSAADAAQAAADAAAKAAADAAAGAAGARSTAEEAARQAAAAAVQVETIRGEVADVAGDAARIREDLTAQLATVVSTLEADYARKTDLTETMSTLRSEIERSAASIVQTVSQTYAKKTDLTDVSADLQTRIDQQADRITTTASAVESAQVDATEAKAAASAAAAAAGTASSDASKAKADAAAAQAAADKAKADAAAAQNGASAAQAAADKAQKDYDDLSIRADATDGQIAEAEAALAKAREAADAAKSTADAAKANASTAQAAADKAKADAAAAAAAAKAADAKAQGAQDAVDAVEERVASAETKVTQNAKAIELAATKTEVTKTLGGYYTKAQADAAIKVQADRITSNVSETDGLKTRVSAVEQTATSLTSRVAGAEGDISTLRQTANGLSVTLGSVSSAKHLASSYATTLATLKAWTAEGHDAGNWTVASTAGVRAGDTVYIRVKVTDADAYVYAVLSVTSVASATVVRGVSHGYVDQSGIDASLAASAAQSAASTARTEAAAAAKTATNYLEYTSAGLDVGNKSSGKWAGFRTRMASSAFQVLDSAGNVLASYGDKLIELGKNAADAVIRLCGGNGEIRYEKTRGFMVRRLATSGSSAADAYVELRADAGVNPIATIGAAWDTTSGGSAWLSNYFTVDKTGFAARSLAAGAVFRSYVNTRLDEGLEIYGNGQFVGNFKVGTVGTASQVGLDQVLVGNGKASGAAGNARGGMYLYGTNTAYTRIFPGNNTTAHNYLNLSAIAGTGTLPAYKALYSNASGTTGTVTLSETAANFSMLEIFYKTNDGDMSSVRVWAPNGKVANLSSSRITAAAGAGWTKSKQISISGTTLAYTGYAGESGIGNNSGGTNYVGSILICYVLGWK
ncbi:phage tail protein [Eggerthella lenta]|uniref:phage tail protein n=1 Tax=Eggerthella lenta TaxID=84112 RepID=UPI0013050DDF|nr:phage tail protein [Eggerthella lenta]